jgi:hypothetical protein
MRRPPDVPVGASERLSGGQINEAQEHIMSSFLAAEATREHLADIRREVQAARLAAEVQHAARDGRPPRSSRPARAFWQVRRVLGAAR